MERESVEYFRARARDECEAALNASCRAARRSHSEMAKAYKRLAEIHDLERLGELAPGKVTSMAEAMRHREQSEYGRGGAHDPALITFAPASDAKI